MSYPNDDYLYMCRRWSLSDHWAALRWFGHRIMWVRGPVRMYHYPAPATPEYQRMLSTAEGCAHGRVEEVARELGKEYSDELVEEALNRLLDRLYGLDDPGPAHRDAA